MATSKEDGTSSEFRVMICVDDSEFAELAFQHYADNAHKAENIVIFVHVASMIIPSHFYSGGMGIAMSAGAGSTPDEVHEIYEKERKKNKTIEAKFRTKAKHLEMKHDFLTLVEHEQHGLGAAIVEAAQKHNMNCIVLGSRGRGMIRRTILGSVSDYVLHHSHIPTLICPKH